MSTSSSPLQQNATRSATVSGAAPALDSQALRAMLTFPDAEQPDIVRSFQKDDYYRKYLGDQLFDLLNRFFGGRVALQNQAEVRLLADAAYLLLQTGANKHTLGEEYCDIMQIDSLTGKPPVLRVRYAMMAAQLLAPYAWQKLATRFPARGAASEYVPSSGDILRPSRAAGRTVGSGQPSLLDPLQRILRSAGVATRSWLTAHFGSVQSVVTFALHLHLALFYFQGRYYQVAKRLVGITYKFTRRIGERRPSYQILGLLIMIQLFVSTLQAARDRLAKLRPPAAPAAPLEQRSEAVEELSAHKCALCLSERRNTAATSCGHLFCWDCITEWCNTKPECPLCRQPVQMQALTAIYHY